jgi:hypothetical protein
LGRAAQQQFSHGPTPPGADGDGRRVALRRDVDERVRDGDLVGHDEPLGVEARLASEGDTLLGEVLRALVGRFFDPARGADVQRHRRKTERGDRDRGHLVCDAGLPDDHDQRFASGEQRAGFAHRVVGGGRAVVTDEDGA